MSYCPQCGTERPPGARGLYCREDGKNCKRDRDRQVRQAQAECRLCGKVPRPIAKALWSLYTAVKRNRWGHVEAALQNIEKIRKEAKAAREARRAAMQSSASLNVGTAAHLPEAQQQPPQGVVADVQPA